MQKKQYRVPMYPNVIISQKRHKQIATEAMKEKVSMQAVAEAKFKLADKMLKELKKDAE